MKRTALPPSDSDLAAYELTRRIKDARLTAEREEEIENQTLAAAGEGEARMALDALGSVMRGRPVEVEEDNLGELQIGPGEGFHSPLSVSSPASEIITKGRRKRERISHAEPKPKEELPASEDATYSLMDATFKKWRVNFLKNPLEANRELARDLGGDAALYHRAGIMRINDTLDAINKLGMLKAQKNDDGGGEDFEQTLEDMRAFIRGDKEK